ncbi:MAG: hypothetical protein P4L98_08095 [Ancalomicrobiaceae bacterium]|nr:hypothetical protein [Ancalomicrobiaceae bacterium]
MGELIVRVLKGERYRALASRLKAEVPELQCRICGGNDFAQIEDADIGSPPPSRRLPVEMGLQRPVDRPAPLLLACSNCGRLRALDGSVLERSPPGERIPGAV